MGLLVVLAAAGACAGPSAEPGAGSASVPSAAGLPAGWRWESFGGVEVGVAGEFGYDNGAQRLSQWCIGDASADSPPVVGRPGAATAVGCPGDGAALVILTAWDGPTRTA